MECTHASVPPPGPEPTMTYSYSGDVGIEAEAVSETREAAIGKALQNIVFYVYKGSFLRDCSLMSNTMENYVNYLFSLPPYIGQIPASSPTLVPSKSAQ